MKEINYYGDTDNYIHLKFGDCRKMYNFTKEFIEKYPEFAREYQMYFEKNDGKYSKFTSPFSIVAYVYDKEIPVHFYYNFTDTEAKDRAKIVEYLIAENSYYQELDK